jgi:hypothetical protein
MTISTELVQRFLINATTHAQLLATTALCAETLFILLLLLAIVRISL